MGVGFLLDSGVGKELSYDYLIQLLYLLMSPLRGEVKTLGRL